MSYYVSGYYQEKAILKRKDSCFPKMRGSGCTDWYNGARKHGQIDNGTSRKGTTGNSSDLCELRKEKEDDSR